MKHSNACKDRYEDIVALVMGELHGQAARELQEHISNCSACRSVRDALVAEESTVRDGFRALARSLEPAERAVSVKIEKQISQTKPAKASPPALRVWKGMNTMFIAHKHFTLTAAALLIAVGAIVAFHVFPPASIAYAMEQTSQANRKIFNYHVKVIPAAGGLGAAWAQMDEKGNLIRLRVNFPEPPNGPKTTFWSKGKANVWFRDKNIFLTVNEPNVLKHFKDIHLLFDPKLAFEKVEKQQKEGKVKVETKLPAKENQAIELIVTSSDQPNHREVFVVDPKTKLIRKIIRSRCSEGTWKNTTFEYLDYNKPIPDEIWEPKLPKEITRIDQTTQMIGLPQDKLNNNEIAVKVAREFFQALIAKDYAKAGAIYEGIPAEKMKNGLGKITFLRVIKIGKPIPHPDPATHFLQVSVEVEIMVNGKKTVRRFIPNIRPAYNQPNRWIIGGGI